MTPMTTRRQRVRRAKPAIAERTIQMAEVLDTGGSLGGVRGHTNICYLSGVGQVKSARNGRGFWEPFRGRRGGG
jgi:hypothetical protein